MASTRVARHCHRREVSVGPWPSMANELRRAKRYLLAATVEIVDLTTHVYIGARTSDLSLVGCYVDTLNPLPPGTAVKMRIAHDDTIFSTFGTVVYTKSNMGMGIKFLKVEHNQLEVLRGWLNKLNGGDP